MSTKNKNPQGWKPNPEGVRAWLNSEENEHPVFMTSASQVLSKYEKKDTHLWIPILWANPNWKRGAQGIGDCFHKDTLIYSPDFCKKITEVQIGERVYAGNGNITTVISKQKKISHNPLVEINSYGNIPIKVTSDHKVRVYRFGTVKEKGKDRFISKTLYQRSIEGTYKSSHKDSVIDIFEDRKPEWIRAGELQKGDILLTPKNLVEEKPLENNCFTLTEAGKWLLGYFLGDGYASESSVSFYLDTEHKELITKVRRTLREFGFSLKERYSGNSEKCLEIRFHNREIAKWFRHNFYSEDGHKRLPSWLLNDENVLQGLFDSDGHKAKGKQHFDSVSPSLAFGVRASLIFLGYEPTIAIVQRSKGSYANAKTLYRVSFSKQKNGKSKVWSDENYQCMPIKEIKVFEGPHKVYDIGVADNDHSLITNGIVNSNCVAWGAELACTALIAKQAYKKKRKGMFCEAATEPIYGGSRVEALGKDRGGYSDGSYGAAAAKWLKNFGTVLRKDYAEDTGISEHDLREYDKDRAKQWGNFGCGGSKDNGKLDTIAKEFPVKTISQVNNFEDVAASIAGSKCPVTIASDYGTDMKRDSKGMCSWNNSWMHQMVLLAVRFGKYPAALCFQSWGPNVASGPSGDKYTENLPNGKTPKNILGTSWWIPAEDVTRICRQGDSYAIGDIEGWKLDKADWTTILDW